MQGPYRGEYIDLVEQTEPDPVVVLIERPENSITKFFSQEQINRGELRKVFHFAAVRKTHYLQHSLQFFRYRRALTLQLQDQHRGQAPASSLDQRCSSEYPQTRQEHKRRTEEWSTLAATAIRIVKEQTVYRDRVHTHNSLVALEALHIVGQHTQNWLIYTHHISACRTFDCWADPWFVDRVRAWTHTKACPLPSSGPFRNWLQYRITRRTPQKHKAQLLRAKKDYVDSQPTSLAECQLNGYKLRTLPLNHTSNCPFTRSKIHLRVLYWDRHKILHQTEEDFPRYILTHPHLYNWVHRQRYARLHPQGLSFAPVLPRWPSALTAFDIFGSFEDRADDNWIYNAVGYKQAVLARQDNPLQNSKFRHPDWGEIADWDPDNSTQHLGSRLQDWHSLSLS